jgi:hypothetical protein
MKKLVIGPVPTFPLGPSRIFRNSRIFIDLARAAPVTECRRKCYRRARDSC